MPRKTTKLELRKGDFEYLRSLVKQRTIGKGYCFEESFFLRFRCDLPEKPKKVPDQLVYRKLYVCF